MRQGADAFAHVPLASAHSPDLKEGHHLRANKWSQTGKYIAHVLDTNDFASSKNTENHIILAILRLDEYKKETPSVHTNLQRQSMKPFSKFTALSVELQKGKCSINQHELLVRCTESTISFQRSIASTTKERALPFTTPAYCWTSMTGTHVKISHKNLLLNSRGWRSQQYRRRMQKVRTQQFLLQPKTFHLNCFQLRSLKCFARNILGSMLHMLNRYQQTLVITNRNANLTWRVSTENLLFMRVVHVPFLRKIIS